MDSYNLVITGLRYGPGTVADRLSPSGEQIPPLERLGAFG